MKKLVFIAIAAIALTTAAQGQDSTSARNKERMERGGKMGGQKMGDELNLTADQKEKMKKMHEDNKVKMDAISNDKSLSDEQKQAKMKELRMDQRKGMESILTDEQKAKMKKMREERRDQHADMKGGSDSTMRR